MLKGYCSLSIERDSVGTREEVDPIREALEPIMDANESAIALSKPCDTPDHIVRLEVEVSDVVLSDDTSQGYMHPKPSISSRRIRNGIYSRSFMIPNIGIKSLYSG